MIYTCTLNPSVDYIIKLDQNLQLGELNRTTSEEYYPGGKGINVSVVLNNLGIESRSLGFIGGYTGRYIEDQLSQLKHTKLDFNQVSSPTRINIKLKGNQETEINASGPMISDRDYESLLDKVRNITSQDIFILSGSVPSSLKRNVYDDIAKIVSEKEALLIVDSNKDHLLTTLKYKPFLIKPNKFELEEIFQVELHTDDEIFLYAKKLMEKGAENVLVSLGSEGAMLVTEDEVYRSDTPKGQVVNTVGAGDSMVAGFVSEYMKTKTFYEALKVASACGSATAFSIGLADKKAIKQLQDQIDIKIMKEA